MECRECGDYFTDSREKLCPLCNIKKHIRELQMEEHKFGYEDDEFWLN